MSIPALTPFPVVVIGGGISGLACAYRLRQAGIPSVLLDAGSRVGGVISTKEIDGFLFELGPQSFLSTEPLLKLIEAVGLKDDLLRADSRAPRYILLGGQLVPAPLAPPSLLTTPLLSARTKWRIFSELFRRTHPPATDESIASFVRRKFGDELLDRLVAPFVSGVYAGDPERLSLRAAFPKLYEFEAKYGSVLRGAMKSRPEKGAPPSTLCTFREGMEALPRALGSRLGDAVQTETIVEGVRHGKTNGKSWFELDVTYQDHCETLMASAVIVAAPAMAASQILRGLSQTFAAPFARIEYAPVAVVSTGYRRDHVQHAGNGFGFLVPRSEGLHILGSVWNSSLFPGRAPEEMICFTSFAGGATDPELCRLSNGKIVETACREVARILGITGKPVASTVQCYEYALPQYNLGHSETVSALAAATASAQGLFLTGNYLSGISIGACVEQANQTADAVRIYLATLGIAGVGALAHA